MDSKLVIFNFSNSRLSTLVKKNNLGLSLPSFKVENMIALSKRRNIQCFYKVSELEVDYEGYCWIPIIEVDKFINNDGAVFCEALGALWPLFQTSSYSIPKLFLKNSFNKDECVFYGGTFNPWHEGHSECLEKCKHENIVIVPDSSPWKDNSFDSCYFETYLKICKNFKDSRYSIFPGFFGLEDPNPTIDWIKNTLVKEKSLLMGDDNFINLFKWKDSRDLMKELTSIYVLARDHSVLEFNNAKEEVTSVNPKINIIYLGEHDFMNLSSSKLRNS